jgi:hypothetical protein
MHPQGIILLDPFPRKIERIFDDPTKREQAHGVCLLPVS